MLFPYQKVATSIKTVNNDEDIPLQQHQCHLICLCRILPPDPACLWYSSQKWKMKQFSDVTIARDGIETVPHNEQQCFFCNVSRINQILYIVMANFKVKQSPAIIIEAECHPTDGKSLKPTIPATTGVPSKMLYKMLAPARKTSLNFSIVGFWLMRTMSQSLRMHGRHNINQQQWGKSSLP